jgi:WD40 repeat protein/DNA-binding SARP family transcriptional activator
MSRLNIRLLGPFEVALDGQRVVNFESDKVRALLAYLAVECARPHRREALAGLLWSEWPEQSARANLRRALANLRQVIEDHDASPPFLDITRQTVQWNTASDCRVDVTAFSKQIARYETDAEAIKPLEAAVSLYGGPFLEGFTVRDSLPFEEWALVMRERLGRQVSQALLWLARLHEQRGACESALPHAWRLVELEPLDEEAHFQLMRLLALSGQRGAALEQYETCRSALAAELGVEPSQHLQKLHEQIASGEWPPAIPTEEGLAVRAPVGLCPYRGLFAFQEEDAPFFFGRETFAERLIEAVQRRAVVAVIVGPSGVGKSSVMYAGLLPRLRELEGQRIAMLRPGSQPFYALAAALLPHLEPDMNEPERLVARRQLAGALRESEVPLSDVVQRVLEKHPGAQRLQLVIDQFEEVYTLCPLPAVRERFIDSMLAAAQADAGRRTPSFGLLLALRADFMGQALAHRPLADALQNGALMLGPMTRDEMRRAVEKPADLQGMALQPGLVERVLDDVGSEPGNLPLLEFALTLMWERHTGGWLTHAAYEAIGRVEGALTRYADEVYDRLSEEDRGRARRVFTQLVRPGEGTEDTRRLVTRDELDDADWALAQRLADERLVVTGLDVAGQQVAEVVHEALIRRWARLREWMDAARVFRMWQEGLRAAIRQWEESDRDEGALLRGAPLAAAEGWLAEREEDLGQAEADFIRASIRLRAEKEAAEAERQIREARLEQHARRVLQVLVGVFLVAAVTSGGLALRANRQRVRAEEAEQDARRQASVGLAGQAQLEIERHNPEIAVLLAMEALEEYPYTWQAEKALGHAIQQSRTKHILSGHLEGVGAAAWSPDGTRIATGSWDGTTKIWDACTGEELLTIASFPLEEWDMYLDWIYDVAWSPDSTRIITASGDFTKSGSLDNVARVWDAATGEELLVLAGHEDALSSAMWSPDGTRILTSSWDGTARVWDSETGAELLVLTTYGFGVFTTWGYEYGMGRATWSPDGNRIVTANGNGTAQVWDATTGEELVILSGDPAGLYGVAWSPNGEHIATGGFSGEVGLWNANTGEKILAITGHSDAVSDIAWSPDGTYIVTASYDHTAKIWDADTGQEIVTLSGHDNHVYGVAWSPDGTQIVTGSTDYTARVWDVIGEVERLTLPIRDVYCTAMAPDGARVASCHGTITRVWDVNTSAILLTLRYPEGEMRSVAWSPDGTQIATASDEVITIWDTSTGAELRTLLGHTAPIGKWIAWSPSGDRLATSSLDGIVKVWDARTWQEIYTFPDYEGPESLWKALSLFWSPSGERICGVSIRDGKATIWDVTTGESLTLDMGGYMNNAAWSPDGKHVVTVGAPGVQLWDATTGESQPILFDQSWSNYAMWSQDGMRIVTASDDGIGRVWDVATGEVMLSLYSQESSSGLWKAVYSPNESFIATANFDGTAAVWDAKTGATRFVLYGHLYYIWRLEWSPDGTHILTASSGDHTARVWRVWQTRQEMIDHARECCVLRQLTPEERELYGLPSVKGQPSGQESSRNPVSPYAVSFAASGLASVGLAAAGRRIRR